jgi:hypothetical protein
MGSTISRINHYLTRDAPGELQDDNNSTKGSLPVLMPKRDITLMIKDDLPEDSLMKILMKGLWEITMNYDPDHNSYSSINSPVYFQIELEKDDSVRFIVMELIFVSSWFIENYRITPEVCPLIFRECLMKLNDIYKECGVVEHEVRKYPIYQILESYYISISVYGGKISYLWRGFKLNLDNIECISIERDDVKIYEIHIDSPCNISKIIHELMEDMKAGTANPALYELPIERIKSAKKLLCALNTSN